MTLVRPALLSRSWWSTKRLAILTGFALTALGSLGPHFYVGPIENRSADVDQLAKTLTARIDNLRNAQSQYLLFEQMGVLVYALNATGVSGTAASQQSTLNDLYQLSLIDRSSAMRQVIGDLARAGQLTYRETSDKYGALIATARKDFSLPAFQAVDDFETAAMRQADGWMARLQQSLLDAEHAKIDSRRGLQAQDDPAGADDPWLDPPARRQSPLREACDGGRAARNARRNGGGGTADRTRDPAIERA